jgi:predicted PurR-regulated permease PerM
MTASAKAPVGTAHGADAREPRRLLPRPALVAAAWAVAALTVAGVVYVLVIVLGRLRVVVLPGVAALLLTALFLPLHEALRRARLPRAAAAVVTVLAFLGLLAGAAYLISDRVVAQLDSVRQNVAAGVSQVRDWLVDGPLSLREQQVDRLADQLVRVIWDPSGDTNGLAVGARLAVETASGVILALFLMFFLLKDGDRMWDWAVRLLPARRRGTADGAGRQAWDTLSGYVRGTVIVALVDGVLLAVALLVLQVPLVLPLALLTFLGAFVPIVGATVAGAAAVLVALVTRGPLSAVLVLAAVIVVQQVEGNLLQPVIMRRAVRIHPVPLVLAVAVGTILGGVAGAVVAVPVLAVAYHVTSYLAGARRSGETAPAAEDARGPG